MKKITFCLLLTLNLAYSQVPMFSYPFSNTFTVGDSVNLTPTLAPGSGVVGQTTVSTFAGSGSTGSGDFNGTAASFNLPTVVTFDHLGNLFVVDRSNHKIRKIDPDGDVTTFAGSGILGNVDGVGTAASFRFPDGAVCDSHNNVFVSDQSNHRIRKITPDGTVTTFAGNAIGSANGNGTAASFFYPAGMAVDADDNLYVADYGNNKIRKIAPNGDVTTLAGNGTPGSAEGDANTAQFNGPTGVCVKSSGEVFVADYNNNKIRKIDALGNVSTYAGSGVSGSTDSVGTNASFNLPAIVALDSANNLFVTDEGNHKIRKITSNGIVSTFAGEGTAGNLDGVWSSARFNSPTGVAVNNLDDVYVADYSNNKIRKIKFYGYSITPVLPTGLSLDPYTGSISGIPTMASPSTNYLIKATNTNAVGFRAINITINAALGLPDFNTFDLKVYPNPATDIVTVSSSEAISEIKILNLLGQEIVSKANDSSETKMDVSPLANGCYLIQAKIGDEEKTIKFLKQ